MARRSGIPAARAPRAVAPTMRPAADLMQAGESMGKADQMNGGDFGLRLRAQVTGEDDPLRAERLARSLRDAVPSSDGVTCTFGSAADRPHEPREDGAGPARKDSITLEPNVWLAIGVASTAGARVVVAAIRAWCARAGGRSVRITTDDGDLELDITGASAETEERVVSALVNHLARVDR